MHEAVDGSHGGHLVFEDLVPLREDQVGADHDGAAFVAFGQEGEDVLIRRCDYHLNLIHPKDYSYFNTLSTKLGWSKKLF